MMRLLLAQGALSSCIGTCLAAGPTQGPAPSGGAVLDAPLGAPLVLSAPPDRRIEPLVRTEPSAPQAGPLRPASPARLDRPTLAGPRLAPPEPLEPVRELAQLRRAAEPRGGFGSSRTAADAAWTLGLLHLHGSGVRASPALAQTWFQRAAPHNRQPWAQAGLAWCLIDGCQGPPDPSGARQAIERLRARQPARAMYLEWLLNTRLRPPGSASEAVDAPGPTLPEAQLLRRAAASGDPQARVELGIDAARRGDLPLARRYFQSAAGRSPAAAANLRALAQHSATNDPQQAREDAEDADGLLAQARRLHRGDGVPANYAEALRLYRLAAARGNPQAQRMVALIAAHPAPGGDVDIAWMAQLARVDTRSSLPQLDVPGVALGMQRDMTPLYDLLPPRWQRRTTVMRPA